MRQQEREAILRESVARAETARERRQLEGLEEDVRASPFRGHELPLRLRNFSPAADGYLASLGGPLPYMLRLREIDALTDAHEHALGDHWRALARRERDDAVFARAWTDAARRARFDEVNDLIERHNRWYPIEARLPMDPRRGDYVLVNGRDYRRRPLGADWVLARFPAVRATALAR
ncbi:MAG: hypothetical protein ACRC50_11110 [Gaiella sp.]